MPRYCPECDSRLTAAGRCPRCDRRRANDQDDRPSSRRRRDDDAVNDRRRARRTGRDEDADDRPRRGRRKKRLNPLWVILPVGGGLALLLTAILLYVFVFDRIGGGGPPSDMLCWAPAEANQLEFVEVARLRDNPNLARGPFGGLNDIPTYGLDPADVVSAMHASGSRGGSVTVLRSRTRIEPDLVLAKLAGFGPPRALTAEGKTYYDVPGHGALYFPSGGDLLVRAQTAATIAERLNAGNERSVVVSKEFRKYLGKAGGDAYAVALARNTNLTMTVNGDRIGAKVVTMRMTSSQVERMSELEYEDPEAARRAEQGAQAVQLQPGYTTRTTRSGSRVRAETVTPAAAVGVSLMEFTLRFKI